MSKIELAKINERMKEKIDKFYQIRSKVRVGIINKSTNELPKYAKEGDSGMDIRAFLTEGDVVLKPGKSALISTGLYFELPNGYEIQVRSRSGLASKNNIFVLNSPGTVDCGYRGELKVILMNLSDEDFVIKNGDRIAQIVLQKVPQMNLIEQEEFKNADTDRSTGGFGHTGN